MAVDIFHPKRSVIADGTEGKVILIYGGNNLGKTAQAVRFPKPFVIACEMGLNGLDDIPYEDVTTWSKFKTIVKQFTDARTVEQAKEAYSTIIVDEVYASSLYCQDYVCSTYGDGALTLADGDGKHNLYQLYEKEYFKQINLLVSAGFTVVFIAHEQQDSQTKRITPKGDKRCMNPIIDKCDYVVYLKSNGVDDNGQPRMSSGYMAETTEFFARARIPGTPTYLPEFSYEALSAAIQEGIDKKKAGGAKVVSFSEQQELNKTDELDFNSLISEFKSMIASIPGSNDPEGKTADGVTFRTVWAPKIKQVTEKYLGKGGKVSTCTENQVEALSLIVMEIKEDLLGRK